MNKNALIPRRKVLGLGVALAGLCAGCAGRPDAGSAESAARSGAASASASTGAEEKAPRTEPTRLRRISYAVFCLKKKTTRPKAGDT